MDNILHWVADNWVGITVIYLAFHKLMTAIRDTFDKTPATDDNGFERFCSVLNKLAVYLTTGNRPKLMLMFGLLLVVPGCAMLADKMPVVTPDQAQAYGDSVAAVIPVAAPYKALTAAGLGALIAWLAPWFKKKYGTKKDETVKA